MLKRITPIRYNRAARSGRTAPLILTCEAPDGSTVKVFAKFSSTCDQGNINLAREVIAACLAHDLGLPVPEAFLIEVPPQWAATLPTDQRAKIQTSSSVAFGSRVVGDQFSTWLPGQEISVRMLPVAASIFVFDGIIQNPDRRPDNPNCLVRGDEYRIFDHELAFSHGLILGWIPPWHVGGLKSMETNGNHIFLSSLRGRNIDFGPIRAAWAGLSHAAIERYNEALPAQWTDVARPANSAIRLVRDARDNFDAILDEVRRVLT